MLLRSSRIFQHLRNAYDIALERGFYKLSTLLDEEWPSDEAIHFYAMRNGKLFGVRNTTCAFALRIFLILFLVSQYLNESHEIPTE